MKSDFSGFSEDCYFYDHTTQIKSCSTISPGPLCYNSVPFYRRNCYNTLPCNRFCLCELTCLSCDLIFYHHACNLELGLSECLQQYLESQRMGKKHMEAKPSLSPLGFHYVSTTNLHNTGKLFKICMILVCKFDSEARLHLRS